MAAMQPEERQSCEGLCPAAVLVFGNFTFRASKQKTPRGGALPVFLFLVPYFPVELNIPDSRTLAATGIVFLIIAWLLCRRR